MRKIKKRLFIIFLVCFFMLSVSIAPATAATTADSQSSLNYDVYLQLDGISGESVTKGYEKWIILADVQFDAANTPLNAAGSSRSAGKAEIKEFTITKQLDASSISLFLNTLTGKHLKSGKIVFVDHTERPTPVLTMELSDVLLTSYSFDNGFETLNLQIAKLQLSYSPTDSKGGKSSPITGGFDFSQNKAQ